MSLHWIQLAKDVADLLDLHLWLVVPPGQCNVLPFARICKNDRRMRHDMQYLTCDTNKYTLHHHNWVTKS